MEITIKQNKKNTVVSIKDTGIGMSSKDLENLGNKFYRANNYIPHNKQYDQLEVVRPGGTGLGLYVTFQLVKMMHGEIDIKSELNKGSEFIITLQTINNQSTNLSESKDLYERLNEEKFNKSKT